MPRIKPDKSLLEDLKEEEKINDQMVAYAYMMGPKKLAKSKLGTQSNWREGYTKPLIEKRKAKNRQKNKAARKARQIQRKK